MLFALGRREHVESVINKILSDVLMLALATTSALLLATGN